MKKFFVLIIAVVMIMAISVPAFAHPMVPEQSLNNVSFNAAKGMHRAWGNVADANGIASHVFMTRHSPH